MLWPGPHRTPEDAAWWHTHQPIAEAWIHDELEHGHASFQMVTDAARIVLYTPVARGRRENPDEPVRPRLSWAEIDACEILMEHALYLPGGESDPLLFVDTMGSFVEDLCLDGIIPEPEGNRLAEEWALWSERLLESWTTGCIYTRQGNVVPMTGHVH